METNVKLSLEILLLWVFNLKKKKKERNLKLFFKKHWIQF